MTETVIGLFLLSFPSVSEYKDILYMCLGLGATCWTVSEVATYDLVQSFVIYYGAY